MINLENIELYSYFISRLYLCGMEVKKNKTKKILVRVLRIERHKTFYVVILFADEQTREFIIHILICVENHTIKIKRNYTLPKGNNY